MRFVRSSRLVNIRSDLFFDFNFLQQGEEKTKATTNFIKVVIKSKYKYKDDENEWHNEIDIRTSEIKAKLNDDSQRYTR